MPFEVAPLKETVQAELIEKLDVRVGTIERVEEISGSDKLVRLVVDFGDRKRDVVVGMKRERKDPREIEGMQALFVVNIETRRIMGTLSEAMLFDIGYSDGIVPVLSIPEKPVPNGARAG